jgi:hypothetical protein
MSGIATQAIFRCGNTVRCSSAISVVYSMEYIQKHPIENSELIL